MTEPEAHDPGLLSIGKTDSVLLVAAVPEGLTIGAVPGYFADVLREGQRKAIGLAARRNTSASPENVGRLIVRLLNVLSGQAETSATP